MSPRHPTPREDSNADDPGLPRWLRAVFSILTTAALFAVMEAGLALAGVRALYYADDPYVGFTSYIPLFVETKGHDQPAVMATALAKRQFFNHQEFLEEKPEGVYRIFCLGGSTTYGRPYSDGTSFCGWLRELLAAADPTRKWEVINCGGISYASYRVAVLMEELVQYDPDLFIVYSAHNEFLERRTYENILDKPPLIRNLVAVLARFRTYSAMNRVLRPSNPSDSKPSDPRETLPGEVDALLDRSVGPEDYTRNDAIGAEVLKHYEFNLTRMVKIARQAQAEVLFVAPASNLRDMSPFKSENRDDLLREAIDRWQTLYDRAAEALARSNLEEALRAARSALAIDDRYAGLHYLHGRILESLENWEQAQAAYIKARDEDVCPLRALSPIGNLVRVVSREEATMLVDFEQLATHYAPHGIPGKELFLDHAHPTIEGNRLLALAIVDGLISGGIVKPTASWNDDAITLITETVQQSLDTEDHGRALRNLARILTWAGKTEEARSIAQRAVEMVPVDPVAHYLLGMAAARLGDAAEAILHYERAIAFAPDYAEAHYSLGAALVERNDLSKARRYLEGALDLQPEHVEARFNLGLLNLKAGNLTSAASDFRQVIALRPNHHQAYHHLGRALLAQEKIEEAKDYFEQSLAIESKAAETYNQMGLALVREGAFDDALTAFAKALDLEPDFAEVYSNLGNLHLSRQQLPQAIEAFEQAIRLKPDYATAHYNLGVARSGMGEIEAALEAYQEALRYDPDHAKTHNNLGSILARQGQLDKALSHFQKALEIRPDYEEARKNSDLARQLLADPNPQILQNAAPEIRSLPGACD